MCLDICPPAGSSREQHEDAARRTLRWAERQVDAPRAPGQLRFGIAQGGTDPELRRRSIEDIVALGFDGNALGGLAVGESREEMLATVGWASPLLPADRPRYFMGLGDIEGILGVIAAGIDMFDCVLPTRTARTGSALTATGRMNLRNARYTRDPRPLEEGCRCPACTRFSRAFIRHLVNQEEILGLRLLSLHNLWLIHRLTAGARDSICRGTFDAFRAHALVPTRRRLPGGFVTGLLIIVLLFGLLWFLMIRPQRARAQEQQRVLSSVAPGDEVLTVGGIYGIVQEIEADEDGGDLVVEIADGIHVRVARKAVATVVKPEDENDGDEDEDEEHARRRRRARDGGTRLDARAARPGRGALTTRRKL